MTRSNHSQTHTSEDRWIPAVEQRLIDLLHVTVQKRVLVVANHASAQSAIEDLHESLIHGGDLIEVLVADGFLQQVQQLDEGFGTHLLLLEWTHRRIETGDVGWYFRRTSVIKPRKWWRVWKSGIIRSMLIVLCVCTSSLWSSSSSVMGSWTTIHGLGDVYTPRAHVPRCAASP